MSSVDVDRIGELLAEAGFRPEPGTHLEAAGTFGEIESTKTVSDLIAPLPGTVSARNQALADDPELVNRDPYGVGWMNHRRTRRPRQLDGLLTAEEYGERTEGQ